MKKTIILKTAMFSMLTVNLAWAQISIGNQPLFMSNASILTVNGLSLQTDGDFSMTNNSIQMKYVASTGYPRNSIRQTYSFQEPVHYHGMVGIHYAPSEMNGNDEKKLQIAIISTTNPVMYPSASSTLILTEHYVFNMVNLPLLAFSAMDPSPAGALPVKLTAFEVTQENQTALLTWITSMEANSDYFEIQKSTNATDWKSIAVIAAKGESDNESRYSFTDFAVSGKTYYRLKMADRDGSYTFSRIRTLENYTKDDAYFYPNPVRNQITLGAGISEKMRSAEIFDTNNRRVFELKNSDSQDVSALLPGLYILKITEKNGNVQNLKMLKQ